MLFVIRHLARLVVRASLAAAIFFAAALATSWWLGISVSVNTPWMRFAARTMPFYLEIDELHGSVNALAVAPHGQHWRVVSAWRWGGLFQYAFSFRRMMLPQIERSQSVMASPVGRVHDSLTASFNTIDVPLWMLVLASAMPAVLAWRARIRARDRTGLCPTCGYDLRATPKRCPECGTVRSEGEVRSAV
jgi:hypothetical protein